MFLSPHPPVNPQQTKEEDPTQQEQNEGGARQSGPLPNNQHLQAS